MGHATIALGLLLAVALPQQRPTAPAPAPGVADRVTLKDGSVVLGEVFNLSDRGKLVFIVGRDWAEKNLPERAKTWEQFEAPFRKQATDERLARLKAWSEDRSRASGVDANDTLLRSINGEIERLSGVDASRPTRLMMAPIDRRDVARVERAAPARLRMLRLGWRASFADVEAMEPADLKGALEGRNFPVQGDEPVSIAHLLPLPLQTEPQWRLQRAATEAKAERAGWFIRHGSMVLPDGGSGQAFDLNALGGLGGLGGLSGLAGGLGGAGGLGDIGGLLRELTGDDSFGQKPQVQRDPLAERLKSLAATGRMGAVVTSLKTAEDLSGVTVESEFWVRAGAAPDSWQSAGRRTAQVTTAQLGANAAGNLEADPQIKQVFEMVDKLGLGQINPELKQRALLIGAATQQALSNVRTEANADLERLALPLGEGER